MKKQLKRPVFEEEQKQKADEDVKVVVNPNNYLEPKVKGYVSLKNQAKRPEGPQKLEQELVVDIK